MTNTAAPVTVQIPAVRGGRTQAEIKVRAILLNAALRGWTLTSDGIPSGLGDNLDALREEHHAILTAMHESIERRSSDWEALVPALAALVERVVATVQAGDRQAIVDGRQVIANPLAMAQRARREELLAEAHSDSTTHQQARELVEEADRCVAVARWVCAVAANREPFRRNRLVDFAFSSRALGPERAAAALEWAFVRPWHSDTNAAQVDMAERNARRHGVLALDDPTGKPGRLTKVHRDADFERRSSRPHIPTHFGGAA